MKNGGKAGVFVVVICIVKNQFIANKKNFGEQAIKHDDELNFEAENLLLYKIQGGREVDQVMNKTCCKIYLNIEFILKLFTYNYIIDAFQF
jgi:hypothetical protein